MELYDYQKQAVLALLNGKKICTAGTGVGKTVVGLTWAKATDKPRVLVCTTASVRDAKGYELEAEKWYADWYQSLDEFTVISWAKLAEWTQAHWDELDQYAIIYDEVDCVCSGISSQRGKAFLQIAKQTDCWTGYTATPFESWIEAYPYFTATGYVKNKTQFKRDFCIEMTYPFPKITGYKDTDRLLTWWRNISDKPDDSEVQKTLPEAVHKTVQFKPPQGYAKCERTSETLDGEFLDNCFVAGTMLDTPNGQIKIDKLNVGDIVYSYNHTTNEIEQKKVTKIYKKSVVNSVLVLNVEGKNPIICTDNHPFFTNDGYVQAQHLKKGDYLYYADNQMQHMQQTDSDGQFDPTSKANAKTYRGCLLFKKMSLSRKYSKNKSSKDGEQGKRFGNNYPMSELFKRTFCKDIDFQASQVSTSSFTSLLLQRMWLRSSGEDTTQKSSSPDHAKLWGCNTMCLLPRSSRYYDLKQLQAPNSLSDWSSVLFHKMWETLHNFSCSRKVRAAAVTSPCVAGYDGWMGERVYCAEQKEPCGDRLCSWIQNRYCSTNEKDWDRMRWEGTLNNKRQNEGPEERRLIKRVRLDNIEILQPENLERFGFSSYPDYVYCIEVEDNHNFFVEGILTHNCSAYRHYMRQLCCSKEKLAWLSDFIQHSDSPVLVLYNYNAELERIDAALAKAMRKGSKVWHINGAEHDIPTAETIGKHDVVLVQWRSGSRGLNLQFMNQWVSLTPYDGYKVSEQGRGRIRRVGQQKCQHYYYLCCKDTVEDTIYEALKNKGELASVAWAEKQKAKYDFKWKEI